MSNIENISAGKKWTDKERIKLYKLVSIKGKVWSSLAKEFDVSPDSCAKKYKSTNWPLIFSRNNTTETKVVKEAIDNYKKKNVVKEETQNILALTKQKLLQQSTERVQRELVERAAITELILEKIESSISKVEPISFEEIKYPKTIANRTPEEACLILSDLHVGLACIPEEVGGLGNYNKDVFLKRLNNLVNSIYKITDIHRSVYRVDTLNIFGLGDFVHGSNDAGKWGFLHTEQNIMDQIFVLVNEITKALLILNKKFNKIKFHGVVGNHGRCSKRGIEKHYVNWDYIVYKMIESSLSNQRGMEFFVPRSLFQVAEVLGYKFLLIHGDQIKAWNSLPIYGLTRADGRYRNMLTGNKNLEGLIEEIENKKTDVSKPELLMKASLIYAKPFDFLIAGHHHQSAEIESAGGGKIILNSSFLGGDDYTINQLLTTGTASQKFFGMHPEGRTWQYDIDLNRT